MQASGTAGGFWSREHFFCERDTRAEGESTTYGSKNQSSEASEERSSLSL
jgi:hypothetical protein